MARSPSTVDAFGALAEPRRRRILEALAGRTVSVTQLVVELDWPQPTVSKHLGVLRHVGLVRAERRSRQMLYEVDPAALRTVHEWSRQFEHLWAGQLDRIKARAEARHRAASSKTKPKEKRP